MQTAWGKLGLAFLLFGAAYAEAVECTEPPGVALRDYKFEFDAAVARVWKLNGPGVSGAVQSQVKNLLDKVPNADRVLIELYYLYSICTALRDDPKMAERDKAKALMDYSSAMRGVPAKTPTAANKSASVKLSATNSAASAPMKSTQPQSTVIENNTGQVNVGNTVTGDFNANSTVTGK